MAISYQKEYISNQFKEGFNHKIDNNLGTNAIFGYYNNQSGYADKKLKSKFEHEYDNLVRFYWLKADIYEERNSFDKAIDTYNELLGMIESKYGRVNQAYLESNKRKGLLILKISKQSSSRP